MIRFLCLLLLSLGWAAARAGAPELRVSAADNFVIDATINGQAVRLRVDPETSGYVILNPATVERIGLRRSMIGSRTQIGPVRLQGWSKVAELRIGGVTEDRRMVWIDRPAIEGADGLIGPADLPYDQIIFDIREVAEHEEAGFPVPLEFDRSGGLYYAFRLGEDMMRVQFSLIKPISLATAAAGARLADLFEGHWIGEPQEQMIEFGVSRPIRHMRVSRPLDVYGLAISRFAVRTADNRGDLNLPPDPDADPDEVVIMGSRQRARFELTLGLDRMSLCSRLVWDNRTRILTLHCSNLVTSG